VVQVFIKWDMQGAFSKLPAYLPYREVNRRAGSGLKRERATQQVPYDGQDFDRESKFIAFLKNPDQTLLP